MRWWAKAGYLGVPFLAPAMYHFTVVALQVYVPHRRLVWTAWGVAAVDVLPTFGIAVYPFGWLPVCAWLTLAAVAIWRHQFVDITPAFAAQQITRLMADARLVVDREGVVRVANEAVGSLAGGIAHAFSNILMVINGYGRLLPNQVGRDDPRRDDIDRSCRPGNRPPR